MIEVKETVFALLLLARRLERFLNYCPGKIFVLSLLNVKINSPASEVMNQISSGDLSNYHGTRIVLMH